MKNSIISLLLVIPLNLFAASINCPQEIHTNQALKQHAKGWEPFVDDWNQVHQFNQISFYAGHPKEHASLAPDNQQGELIWNFTKNEIWLACGYLGTTVQLIQKLPATIKHCTATYSADFSNLKRLNCV
ncbi:MAG: hypothetical protein H0U70_10645 [Tatlockia sp.]|nr:hypothetical protein [Tatlockia sp.]